MHSLYGLLLSLIYNKLSWRNPHNSLLNIHSYTEWKKRPLLRYFFRKVLWILTEVNFLCFSLSRLLNLHSLAAKRTRLSINQRPPVAPPGWIGQFQVDFCLCGGLEQFRRHFYLNYFLYAPFPVYLEQFAIHFQTLF